MKTGLSSILTQLDPETQQHQVVGYHSRSTTPQEQRYSKIEIENAVIEFGVTKNYICLYWLPEFTIIRDHKPLVSIYSAFQRQPPPRILKHKLRIQGYNYTLQYEQGGAANLADYLSRNTKNMYKEINALEMETENFIDAIVRTCLPTALTIKEIQQTMCNDPQMQVLS